MVSKEELIIKVNNSTISDGLVFEVLNEYCADKYDNSGTILVSLSDSEIKDLEDVAIIVQRVRPQVMEMLRNHVVEQHKNCCYEDLD